MAQPDYTPGTWEAWVQQQAAALGLTVTSGYRDPSHNAAVGGSPTSLHQTGSPTVPGAIDVGGPAAKLQALFDEIKQAFQGRINELYLNLPGGQSQDIKNNQSISSNPEAGNPQHLHISLGSPGSLVGTSLTPAPAQSQTSSSNSAAGFEECQRSFCLNCWVPLATPRYHCWSDVWMYGAALALIVGGSWMVFRGGGGK